MQPEPEVKEERTGWRDEEISRRHRKWGYNCPAVDLDFLVAEYNFGAPVAIVEYKHYLVREEPNLRHPTYRAIRGLADGYKGTGIPFLISFYWPEIWAFCVLPANQKAKEYFSEYEMLNERDFVSRLYTLRNMTIKAELAGVLNTTLPSEADAA